MWHFTERLADVRSSLPFEETLLIREDKKKKKKKKVPKSTLSFSMDDEGGEGETEAGPSKKKRKDLDSIEESEGAEGSPSNGGAPQGASLCS